MFFATFRQQKHNVEVLAVRVSANLSGSVETFQSDALLMVWLGLAKLGNHADVSSKFSLPFVQSIQLFSRF